MNVRQGIASLAAAVVAATMLSAITSPASASTGEGGTFVPVTPTLVADTRSGVGLPAAGAVPAGTERTIQVTGIGGVPKTDVSAVVVDIAAESNVNTSLYAYPAEESRGLAILSVNGKEERASNTAIVRVNSSGKIKIHNNYGNTDWNVGVQGYFTKTSTDGSTGGFVPIQPERMVRTDTGVGLNVSPLKGGTQYTVQLTGKAGIPANATAVFANFRIRNAAGTTTGRGGLRVGPSNTTISTSNTSVLDYASGYDADSGLAVKLGPDGKIKVLITANTTADLIIDVQGYFTAGSEGGSFTPQDNRRIWDSRSSAGGALAPREEREIRIAGGNGIPGDAGSVAMTVTALDWKGSGSLAVYNSDNPMGANGTSNVAFAGTYNDTPRQSTAIVKVSETGTITLKNLSTTGSTQVLLNTQGWFAQLMPERETPKTPEQPAEDDFEAVYENGAVILSAIVTGPPEAQMRARFILRRGSTTVFDGPSDSSASSGEEVGKTISGVPNGTYSLQVHTSDGTRSSPASSEKTYTWDGRPLTADDPSTPDLRTQDGEEAIVVSNRPTWTTAASGPPAAKLRYELELQSSAATPSASSLATCRTVAVDSGSDASCAFAPELTDGDAYRIRARAVINEQLDGPWSVWSEFTVDTTPYLAMHGVTVEGATASFELEPNAFNNAAVRGRVSVTEGDGATRTVSSPYGISGEATTVNVTDLAPGTYSYELYADSESKSSRVPTLGSFEILDPTAITEPDPDSCAEFASENIDGNWSCIDKTIYSLDENGEEVETISGPEDEQMSTMAVLDSYHAKKSRIWYFGTGSRRKGSVRFTFNIGLHNHSANVWMTADVSQKARITWRTRIRHDRTAAVDTTLFTYRYVHGCSGTPKASCRDEEGRYGDGKNRLPYQTRWKVFWEAYDTNLIVNGVKYPGSPRTQSDRATCFKTTSCKFQG